MYKKAIVFQVLLVLFFLLNSSTVFAFTRGDTLNVNWTISGAGCFATTDYTDSPIYGNWYGRTLPVGTDSDVLGILKSVGTFTFTCNVPGYTCPGAGTPCFSTTVVVNDCPPPTTWNGSACVANSCSNVNQYWNGSACANIPNPSGVTASCNAAGNQITFSWTKASGWDAVAIRAQQGATMPYTLEEESTATSKTFAVTPGLPYSLWMHTREVATGHYSSGITPTPNPITCTAPLPPTITTTLSPTTIDSGDTATLKFSSTGATQCEVLWSEDGGTTYDHTTIAKSHNTSWDWGTIGPYRYGYWGSGPYWKFTCWNVVGASTSKILHLAINTPTASFTATPACRIVVGDYACNAAGVTFTSSHTDGGVTLTDFGPGLYTQFNEGSQTYNGFFVPYPVGSYRIYDGKYATQALLNSAIAGSQTVKIAGDININSSCDTGLTYDPNKPNTIGSNKAAHPTGVCVRNLTIDSFTSDDANVAYGGSTTLRWTASTGSTGTITCTIDHGVGSGDASGSKPSGALYADTDFKITCDDGITPPATRTINNGIGGGEVSVSPKVTLTASPTTVTYGQQTTFKWSSVNAVACDVTSIGGAVNAATSNAVGLVVTPPKVNPSSYAIKCKNAAGYWADSNIVDITVIIPSATISAQPTRVAPGTANASSKITWDSTDTTSCFVSGPGLSILSKSNLVGVNVSPTSQATYTISCTTAGASVSDSVVVNVVPDYSPF